MGNALKIAVIIPCYNTGQASVDVIARARMHADAVLVIDDGSTDETRQLIGAAAVPCLRLAANAGKGAALKAGIEEVLKGRDGILGDVFDYILTIDGDGQHDPVDIPRLVARAKCARADLVVGVRTVRAMPAKSRIGNSFARLMFFLGTSRYVPDTQSGFRLFSRALAVRLLSAVSWRRYETEAEFLAKAVSLGYTVDTVEISTIYFDRNRGSHFDPLWDSMRVIAVLGHSARASLAVAAADLAAFIVLLPYVSGQLVRANLVAGAFAIVLYGALTRGDVFRTKGQFSSWEVIRFGSSGIAKLAATTGLLVLFWQLGASPLPAKILAQLTSVLFTFVALEARSEYLSFPSKRSTLSSGSSRPRPAPRH